MNRLSLLNRPRYWLLVAILALAIGGWMTAGPPYALELAGQAEKYRSSDPVQAVANYKMAAFLDPSQPDYHHKMADIYLEQNQPSKAIKALDRAGTDTARLRAIETELRSSRFQAADKRIQNALKRKQTPELYILQAKASLEAGDSTKALTSAKAAGGNQAVLIETWIVKIQAKRQPAAGLALARDLYNNDLPVSANQVLSETAPESTLWYVLKTDILLSRQPLRKENLLEAKDHLKAALEITPYDIDLHRRLKAVLEKLEDKPAAEQEGGLIRQLESQK